MEKAGVGGAREGENPERQPQSGPTQLHRLLELVREEQNIFNIVFHEIIRQVCTCQVGAEGSLVFAGSCW